MMRKVVTALALIAAVAVPAAAQDADQAKPGQGTQTQKPPAQTAKPKPPPKPKTPKLPIGFRGFFAFETTRMSAADSFSALTGSSSVPGFGLGAEVLNVWRKMFMRVGFSSGSAEGERGFVTDDGFVSTGVPIDIGVRTVEFSAGWRDYLKKHPKFAIYGGGGLLFSTISQNSAGATDEENSSSTGTGFVATGGFDYLAWKRMVVGAEVQFRSAGGLGDSGVSQGFGESNSGGFSIRGIVGYRFKK